MWEKFAGKPKFFFVDLLNEVQEPHISMLHLKAAFNKGVSAVGVVQENLIFTTTGNL